VNCSFWKLAAAFRHLRPLRLEPIFDDRLPTYAVLVPLYREAALVGTSSLISVASIIRDPSCRFS